MLIATFQNLGTNMDNVADYAVTVYINKDVIWKGRVEGHERRLGWRELLRQLANSEGTTS